MLHRWWAALSGEAKAAIIAAIVSPVVSEILGVRTKMIRQFYMRALEKMEAARVQLREEARVKHPKIFDVDKVPGAYEDDPFYPKRDTG
jgi:Na+/pantothenate symporter